jgi:hypothetical protein
MQQAFTGALPAVWEAEHAYEIATEQARARAAASIGPPGLRARASATAPQDPVLITSLMKYVFLLQEEFCVAL